MNIIMKKYIFVLCLCAFTLSVFAAPTYTAKVKITMSSANADDKSVTIREAATFSDAYDDGYDSENPNAGGLYVIAADNSKWLKWATNNMEGVKLGLTTGSDLSYTFTFSGVVGTTYYLKDAVTGTEKLIAEGETYGFEAAANSTINDRFVIGVASAPAVKQICFNDEKLQLTKYAGAKVDVYLQGEAAPAKSETVVGDAPYEINLSTLDAGEYVVKIDLDGDAAIDEQYRITVKPTLSAYTPVVP